MALQPTGTSYTDYPDHPNQQHQVEEHNLHVEDLDDPVTVTDRYFNNNGSSISNNARSVSDKNAERPMHKKTWFWLLVAGVVLVLGVVGTSVGLARSGNEDNTGVGATLQIGRAHV